MKSKLTDINIFMEEVIPDIKDADYKEIITKKFKIPQLLKPGKNIEMYDVYLEQLSLFDNMGKEYYLGKSHIQQFKEVFTDKVMLIWLFSLFVWISTLLYAPIISLVFFIITCGTSAYLFIKNRSKKSNLVVLQ